MEKRMIKFALGAVATLGMALGLTLASSGAIAAEKALPRVLDKTDNTQVSAAADAPNARLVALVSYTGKIVQSKGLDSITRIDRGVYCVKPAGSTGIDVSKSVAIVTPEWSYTNYINEVMAQWARAGSGCGSGRFGVITLSDYNLN